MTLDPRERLAALCREVQRHRDAVREFGLAGYVTKVEQHKAKIAELQRRIRALCNEHELTLPTEALRR